MNTDQLPTAVATILSGDPQQVALAKWAFMTLSSAIVLISNPKSKFTPRVEGHALTALCFRNGPLEDAHAENNLDDSQMKRINIWSSRALTSALAMKGLCDNTPIGKEYWSLVICAYHDIYCHGWQKSALPPEEEE